MSRAENQNRDHGRTNPPNEPSEPLVLVVEDNDDERLIYTDFLRHYGYRILEAKNAQEGVRLAQEHRPDVILMDIRLPLVNGLLATEVLKLARPTADIPVIAMSTYDMSLQRVREVGCINFLAKPIEPRTLVEAVARCTGNAAKK